MSDPPSRSVHALCTNDTLNIGMANPDPKRLDLFAGKVLSLLQI